MGLEGQVEKYQNQLKLKRKIQEKLQGDLES